MTQHNNNNKNNGKSCVCACVCVCGNSERCIQATETEQQIELLRITTVFLQNQNQTYTNNIELNFNFATYLEQHLKSKEKCYHLIEQVVTRYAFQKLISDSASSSNCERSTINQGLFQKIQELNKQFETTQKNQEEGEIVSVRKC